MQVWRVQSYLLRFGTTGSLPRIFGANVFELVGDPGTLWGRTLLFLKPHPAASGFSHLPQGLESMDLSNYRFLLNQQSSLLRGLPVKPLEAMFFR